ncbi:hypothetical protein [Pseudomonas sp. AU11447]|uniref:hypothetical protein n=1 Tax=Pseudomonas sp. AU11447 TaxID=1843184 RepID=UPI00111195B9|nr:hypothetical protein [Pseudomonas sp. AU11447]
MSNRLPADALAQLVELLKESAESIIETMRLLPQEQGFINSGMAYMIDLEDHISSTERRGDYRLSYLLEELAKYNNIPLRNFFSKPRFANGSSSGYSGLPIFDAVALIIILEDLGFRVNPKPLATKLAKTLKTKEILTESELSVWCYEKQRNRGKITLRSDINIMSGPWQEERFKGAYGHRYKLTLVDEKPYRLEATGPLYRNLKPRQEITCEYCGFFYLKGDLESSLLHRSEHARLKRILEPKPLSQFAKRLLHHPTPEQVNENSPLWMQHEVRERAIRFKREFRYDFLQWNGSSTKKVTSNVHGYLFSDHTGTFPPGTIIGACAFVKRQGGWSLDWIWVIPSMRRRGVLLERWHAFLERYGDFDIEHPLSAAMEAFTYKHGTPQQRSSLPPLL